MVVKSEFKLPGPLPKRRKNKGSAVAATPSFARKIRKESVKQSFRGTHSASKQKALDLLSEQLTAENTSAEAMALKKRAQDMENVCPNVEEATGSLAEYVERREQDTAASNTGSLNRPVNKRSSAAGSTGLKGPAAGWGLGLKRVVKRSALSKPVVAAVKKASVVASKKTSSPGGLPSSQSTTGFDYGDSD